MKHETKHVRSRKNKTAGKSAVAAAVLLMATAMILCGWLVHTLNLPKSEKVESAAVDLQEQVWEPSARQLLVKQNFEDAFLSGRDQNDFEKLALGKMDSDLATTHLLLYDVTHSKILFAQNENVKCFPASTTKLLTACVAAQFCSADTEFTVGEEISLVPWDSSKAGLEQGNRLTFEMLMDAMLMPSGNDAAAVMAAGVGRIYAEDPQLPYEDAIAVFVNLMNQTAEHIGAFDSHFTCPDGYHSEDHYVTAADMLKIAVYASSFDCICQSYRKLNVSYTLLSGESFTWYNSNPLINPGSAYYIPSATGMKTGFTDQAGSCLVASAEKDGVEIIAVALNGPSSEQRNQDLFALLNAAFDCCIL